MLSPLQLELTQLIGKKELTFGCLVWPFSHFHRICYYDYRSKEFITNIIYPGWETNDNGRLHTDIVTESKIIGHPATLSDFHRCMNEKWIIWSQWKNILFINQDNDIRTMFEIPYDSSKDLLNQEDSILEQIISLIKENGNSLR